MNIKEDDFKKFKQKMLNWANQFNIFCLLDNNNYNFTEPAFECLLAVGCRASYTFDDNNSLEGLQYFFDKNPTWLFGHLGYNALGNAYPNNKIKNNDFSNGFFFEPTTLIKLSLNKIEVLKSDIAAEIIIEQINNCSTEVNTLANNVEIQTTLSKQKYIEIVKKLQAHIKRGDCYEINFCQQFFAENASICPIETYIKLTEISPTPYSALYKLNDNFCLCASPERFLQKNGQQLISQPIKGTSKRNADIVIDAANKKHLQESKKERSENVMVVDLVRNDMSMICQKGSVKVKELFGIYSFPQVHQMISTIEGKLCSTKTFSQAIAACYPMGSMTGAPKQRVMQLIAEYEASERGVFSGSIGYIMPNADFDFNVVIRSIFYNQTAARVSFFAGSGITFYSQPEEEYNECLAKVEGIMSVLKTT